jgi:hypothetical protein
VLLSVLGTPVWPWFHSFLSGHAASLEASGLGGATLLVMLLSAVIALGGIAGSWSFYSRRGPQNAADPDPLEQAQPILFAWLRGKFFIDELYANSVIRWNSWCARASRWLDDKLWGGAVTFVSYLVLGFAWLNRLIDEFVVNLGFDRSCRGLRFGARVLSFWQNGQVQRYLRAIGLALAIFGVIFIWGCK